MMKKSIETVNAIVALLVQHDEKERNAILDAVRALMVTAPKQAAESPSDSNVRPQGVSSR